MKRRSALKSMMAAFTGASFFTSASPTMAANQPSRAALRSHDDRGPRRNQDPLSRLGYGPADRLRGAMGALLRLVVHPGHHTVGTGLAFSGIRPPSSCT